GERPTARTVRNRRITLRTLIRRAAWAGKHQGLNREGESTFEVDEPPPIPEQHHRWPTDFEGDTCPVCGCPGDFLRNKSGHIPAMRFHRRVAEGAWETAYYSKRGWCAIRRVGSKAESSKAEAAARRAELLKAEFMPSQPAGEVAELAEAVRALLNREGGGGSG